MRSLRMGAAVLLTIGLGAPLVAAAPMAHADTSFTEIPVSIPASTPDDFGNPVTLDGGIDIPTQGCPCPVIVINHGFLGQWRDSGDVAASFAAHGYIVLRYSSRGFGNTPGQVDLIGQAERQDFLDAVHFVDDPNNPTTPQSVKDLLAAAPRIPFDVGQYGGSYGGGHAWWAAMSGDPGIKAAVPTATWSDFYQALLPNDVMLAAYANGFYATGYDPTGSAFNNATSGDPQPTPPDLTQNYSVELHKWMAEANSGVDVADIKSALDDRSVMYHLDQVHIPVFIVQGSNDGLFTENQALEAYQALRARGVPARLYIGGIGHPPSDGATDHPEALHIGAEMLMWFDHYLKGADNGINSWPPIEFSHTTYFNNHWDGTTQSATSFPAGGTSDFFLCSNGAGGGTLETTPCAGTNPLVTTSLPSAGGYDQEPVTRKFVQEGIQQLTCQPGEPVCQQSDPDLDSYPSTLTFTSNPLPASSWFGPPHLDLQVGAVDVLPAGVQGAAAAFQLDPKFYDVDPSTGTATLITRGAYAQPLDANAPSQQTLPQHDVRYDAFGLSYLLPAGHELRLTLSTSDAPYLRPTVNPFAVALFSGSKLSLDTTSDAVATPPVGDVPADLPEAAAPAALGAAALLVVGLVVGFRTRSARTRRLNSI